MSNCGMANVSLKRPDKPELYACMFCGMHGEQLDFVFANDEGQICEDCIYGDE